MTRVLLVGFTADALPDPPVPVDTLRQAIADGYAAVEEAGYDVEKAWIDADFEAGLAGLRTALTDRTFDVVMVGNGVRGQAQYTELFERVVNIAHELAPRARFAFNTDPGSSLDAVRRNS